MTASRWGEVKAVLASVLEAPAAGRPLAARHQARTPAEDRIGGIEGELPGPELGPDRRHQLAQQSRPGRDRNGVRHHDTCRPVNQPAASSTRRASSLVR